MKTIGGSNGDIKIEVAILLEDISSKNNDVAKFRIPTIMNNDDITTVNTSSKNIKNRKTNKGSKVDITNAIELPIPYHLKLFYGKKKIPKGTEFLVELSNDNIDNSRIIGLYDSEVVEKYQWNYLQLERKVEALIHAVSLLQKYQGINQDWSD